MLHARTWQLGSMAIACAIVYVLALILFTREARSHEETFVSATTPAPVKLYIDELAFDPVRQSLSVRIDLASGSTAHGSRYGGPYDRDIQLSISDGDSEQVRDIHRNDVNVGFLLSLDVSGALENYPFDRYASGIVIAARERLANGAIRPVPIVATVWEGIPGWAAGIRLRSGTRPDAALAIAATLKRPLPVVCFAVVFYSLMLAVAVCSLCIGGLVFAAVRKVESTIVGALAAVVFSIAALRAALPGAPPIGVTADIAIFLWAEIGAIAGLSLLVFTWVRRGPGF